MKNGMNSIRNELQLNPDSCKQTYFNPLSSQQKRNEFDPDWNSIRFHVNTPLYCSVDQNGTTLNLTRHSLKIVKGIFPLNQQFLVLLSKRLMEQFFLGDQLEVECSRRMLPLSSLLLFRTLGYSGPVVIGLALLNDRNSPVAGTLAENFVVF